MRPTFLLVLLPSFGCTEARSARWDRRSDRRCPGCSAPQSETVGDLLAFDDVSIATSEFAINGVNSVWRQNRLFLPFIGSLYGSYTNPIIKIVSSTRAYLAYMVSYSQASRSSFTWSS